MQKITPFLWFNNNAEEAIQFYASVFPGTVVGPINRWGKEGPGPEGTMITATIQLLGQEFAVLNGGPQFSFTPAVSFVVHCETQEEVDHYWELLSEGGARERCGWLKDRFGLSWQVVPTILPQLIQGSDQARKSRVMLALMTMDKIEIEVLEKA